MSFLQNIYSSHPGANSHFEFLRFPHHSIEFIILIEIKYFLVTVYYEKVIAAFQKVSNVTWALLNAVGLRSFYTRTFKGLYMWVAFRWAMYWPKSNLLAVLSNFVCRTV